MPDILDDRGKQQHGRLGVDRSSGSRRRLRAELTLHKARSRFSVLFLGAAVLTLRLNIHRSWLYVATGGVFWRSFRRGDLA